MLKLPCICFILSLTIYNLQASSTDDSDTAMQLQAADALLALSYAPNQTLSSITVPIPSIPSTIPMEDDNTPPQSSTTHSTYLPPFLAACDHIIQQTAYIQTGEYYLQRAAYIKEHYAIQECTHNKETLTNICEAFHKSGSAASKAKNTLVYEPTIRSMMEDKCYLWEIAWVLGITDYNFRKGMNVYLNNCGEGKLFDSIGADIAELYRGKSHTYKKKSYESKGPPKAFIEEQVRNQISEGKVNSEIKVAGVLYKKLKNIIKMLRQPHDDASLSVATPSSIPPFIHKLFPEKVVQGRPIKNKAFMEMDNAYREFLITHLREDQHNWQKFNKHMEVQGILNRLTSKNFTDQQIYTHFYIHLDIPCDINRLSPVISRDEVKGIVKTKYRDQAECDIGKIIESLLADYPKKQLYAGIKGDIKNALSYFKRSVVQSGSEDDDTPQGTTTHSTYLPPFLTACDHIIQQTAGIQTSEYYLQRAAYIKEHYTKHKSTHSKVKLSTICTEFYNSRDVISEALKTLVYEPTLRSMMEDKCYLWEIAWVLGMKDHAVRKGINVYLNNCGEDKLFDSIDADIAELYSERSHTYKKKKYESKGPPKAFIEDQVRNQISDGKDNREIKVPGVLYNKLKHLIKILRQSYDDAALTAAVPLTEATPHTIALCIHNLFPEKARQRKPIKNQKAFMEMDNAYREFLITRLGKQQHSWKKFKRHMEEQGIWDRLISKNLTRDQIRSHFYYRLEIPSDIDPSLTVISRSTVKDIVKTKFRDKAECDDIIQFLLADYPNNQLYAGIKGDIKNVLLQFKRSSKTSAVQSGTEGEERGEPQAKKATNNRNSDDSSQQTLSPVPTENTSLSTVGLNDATDNVSLSVISKHEVDQSINIVLMAKSICSIDDVITYLTENYPNKQLYAGIKKDIRKQLFRKRGKKPAVQSTIASINNDATDNVSPMPLENHLGSAKRSIYNSPSACLAAKSKTADEEDEHGESLAKKAKQ